MILLREIFYKTIFQKSFIHGTKMRYWTYLLWIICLAFPFDAGLASDRGDESSSITAFTMSDVNRVLQSIAFDVILQVEGTAYNSSELLKADYLIPLASFIDLSVIGRGNVVTLHQEKIIEFIINALKKGDSVKSISTALVEKFKASGFKPEQKQEAAGGLQGDKVLARIGGYAVTEFEYHREPDGEYVPLLEINQLRLFFSAQVSPADAQNSVSFFGEMNPVPEEVIHQIEQAPLTSVGITDTLLSVTPEIDETIDFEQLYIRVGNLKNSGYNITIGQIRNPFGFWADYTSHRNFTSTKNNTLVNGFALKKIELGLQVDKQFPNGIHATVALVNGRKSRTTDLPREDDDKAKDFVGRISYDKNRFTFGASTYLAEFSLNKNYAYGLNWQYLAPKLSLSGELVFQKNNEAQALYENVENLSSLGSYAQFNYRLENRMTLYGLYETWRLFANGIIVDKPTYKIFHGLVHQVNQRTRWTIVELGFMFHHEFDDGNLHLSTQLEVSY